MNTSASEAEQRAAILAAARSWIGTPYHNCADVKGAGVDCGMLLVRVFVDAGLCEPFDPRPYPPDWHLHRAEEKYLGFVFDRTHEVFLTGPLSISPPQAGERGASGSSSQNPNEREGASGTALNSPPPLAGEGWEGASVQPGDIAVFRFGRCYSHGGIVVDVDPLAIVHAYAPARCVLEERVHQNAVLSEAIRKPRFFSWRQTPFLGSSCERAPPEVPRGGSGDTGAG